jgi:hypothetical protein
MTKRLFNRAIARISELIHAGQQGTDEYRRLIDIAWATAPDDIHQSWYERAIELGFIHLTNQEPHCP